MMQRHNAVFVVTYLWQHQRSTKPQLRSKQLK